MKAANAVNKKLECITQKKKSKDLDKFWVNALIKGGVSILIKQIEGGSNVIV